MRATFCSLTKLSEAAMRATQPAIRQELTLWNQKVTDTGSLLFAGMARSHNGSVGGRHAGEQKGSGIGSFLVPERKKIASKARSLYLNPSVQGQLLNWFRTPG